MRPKVLRRRLILAGFGAVLAGATIGTGMARADVVDDYVARYAPAVCSTLDAYPTVDGVTGVGVGIIKDGLSPYQSGEVLARSVIGWCPEHLPELQAFVAKYGGAHQVIA